ncbi:MAG: condensation domain-containing protein, partial [Chitinophagaceae bacterium]
QLPAVINTAQSIAEATNAIETVLLNIWKRILDKENIGIHHNFFEHGGHSLKAIRLIGAITEEFKATIKLQDIFVHPTVHQQAILLQSAASAVTPAIQPAIETTYYPLSAAQLRMWVIRQVEDAGGYNICGALQLEGELKGVAWESAWAQLLQRHEILRTAYMMHEGRPHQRVMETDERWNIAHTDARMNGLDIDAIYRQHEQSRFNLEQGPVVRATLVQCAGNRYWFVFALHHIAADEWTLGILYEEMLQLYKANCNNEQPLLRPLNIRYRDYAVWENQLDATLPESREYWLNAFSGELPVLEFPADHARPAVKSHAGAGSSIALPGVAQSLQQLCNAGNSSMFMGLIASVHVLLFRYCHQCDLITGIPVSGRDHNQLQDNAGLFLNTLPIRSQLSAADSYQDVLMQVRDNTVKAFEHKDYPFDRLVENLNLKPDLSRSALFDVSIVMHDQAFVAGNYTDLNLSVTPYKGPVTTSKFDLSFQFSVQQEELQLELIYNTDLFNEERIALILAHYRELLNAAIACPGTSIDELNYVSQAEKNDLLNTFQGKSEAIISGHICSRFASHVAVKKDTIAVTDINNKLSYDSLDKQSGALAAHLIKSYGVEPGDVIALRMGRSVNMIVSMLAILKTGAAYLPLDKSFPQQRVDYMLQDSNVKMMISDQEVALNIPSLLWDDKLQNILKAAKRYDLADTRTPGSIAYIIYTSGTTGNPKGVRITDHSLLHYAAGINDAYQLQQMPELRGLLASSIAFDLGYTSLWGMLLLGGELQLLPESDYWEPRQVLRQVKENQIGFIKLTPSHFRLLLNEVLQGEQGG